MSYVENDGVKIYYVSSGEGEDVLFFVHGLGESHETWKPQLEFFPSIGFKVLAIDLRGHGKSSLPKKRIEMKDFASDVYKVIENEDLDKVNFIGYSMGALVLFELYKLHSELFNTLVLEATVPQYPPAQTAQLINMSMHEIARQVADFAVSPLASDELKEDIYRIISKTDKEVYIESAEAACASNYTSLLSEISIPTLILSGELDYISPPEAAYEMNRLICNSEVYIFEKTGHMPHRERPEEYNKVVYEFLEKHCGD